MQLYNKINQPIKAFIYQTNNIAQTALCEYDVVSLEPNSKQSWNPSPEENNETFVVKFFHPELFDRPIASAEDVPKDGTIHLILFGRR